MSVKRDDRNIIEILEENSVEELREAIHFLQEHLPVTKEVKDINFQVHDGKYTAAIVIGTITSKSEDKEKNKSGKETLNLMGG